MDPQTLLLSVVLFIGALVVGGIGGAVWAFRQPDPNPKEKTSAKETNESQQQEV